MTRLSTRAIALLLIALVASCSQTTSIDETTELDGPTGRISGSVTLAYANIPSPTIITNNSKDPQICGSRIAKLDIVIAEESRGIANVIVWIDDLNLPAGYRPRRQDLRLAVQRCQFTPHVAALTVGSTIQVRNADMIEHSANLSGAQDDRIQLTNQGEIAVEARAAGIIKIQCADHEWMEAFVRVDLHPYHAVTNSEGEFTIDAVPVGTHKLRVWHERLGEQESEATVRSAEVTRVELHCPSSGTR